MAKAYAANTSTWLRHEKGGVDGGPLGLTVLDPLQALSKIWRGEKQAPA